MGKDCVQRNDKLMPTFTTDSTFIERIKVLKKFVVNPCVDMGCGGFMPSVLNTTHACDDTNYAKECLTKRGWKGKFRKLDLGKKTNYKDKEFKTAVCSEVIEHLNNEDEIRTLFREIDRISENWIVTTPSAFFDDPDHKFFFGPNELISVIPFDLDKVLIVRKGVYYYISNDKNKLAELLKVKC